MTATKTRRRYTVRKQSSGYTLSESYYVYDLVKKGRVTVHAHQEPGAAWNDADRLEISAMVHDYEDDPRPYAERLTEAAQRFAAGATAR